jgi:hypothetical protein
MLGSSAAGNPLIACSSVRAASALSSSLFIEPHVGDGQRTSDSESASAANRPHVKQRKYTPISSAPRSGEYAETAVPGRETPDRCIGAAASFTWKESTTLTRPAGSP